MRAETARSYLFACWVLGGAQPDRAVPGRELVVACRIEIDIPDTDVIDALPQ